MFTWVLLCSFAAAPPVASTDMRATQALAVLRKHCHRCHGQDGTVEGGLNYILERDKLVARRKLVPGDPAASRLLQRIHKGTMPPPDESPRPNEAEIAVLTEWIRAGAPAERRTSGPTLVTEAQVHTWVLADLSQASPRNRRFLRYLSLVSLANAGAGPDELRTQRNAVSKLLNSLSWHPRIRIPEAIDPAGLVLRIDLRDYLWDANLWNRLLRDYPYGVLREDGIARAVLVYTATRVPVVRADWFVATASRAPLYYDLLQIPSGLGELERQLRVDSAFNIQQERVARAGFNGSGVSRNNRLLERHDAMNGAYWRTYDFEAVPENLLERNLLAPDRRNLFAFPLGPGLGEAGFRHAGGEVIFNLPNGLQAYMLVDANNQRINKGPTEIVSDPKRPDRAVEAGLSCMHCHATGILPKDDQLREHVLKNPKAFRRRDRESVEALHPPAKTMRALMADDAKRHQEAVARTGNKALGAETVLAMTLRYESDVDLPTLAAELGVSSEQLRPALTATETLTRNLGALKVPGGTVARQVVAQSFAELAREAGVGLVFDPSRTGESLPDATGEADPLEVLSQPANAVAFAPDGKRVAIASQDRSVRLLDPITRREVRRLVGHTASVWCVAFSGDGAQLLSGGKDGTVRLWDAETGRERATLEGHGALVTAVAFHPNGKQALSVDLDGELILWDLDKARAIETFRAPTLPHPQALAFTADGREVAIASEANLVLRTLADGATRTLRGHTGWINALLIHENEIITGSDDGTIRRWNRREGTVTATLRGHNGAVLSLARSSTGTLLSGGADGRVWRWPGTGEGSVLHKGSLAVRGVHFSSGEKRVLSVDRDALLQSTAVPARVPAPTDRPDASGSLTPLKRERFDNSIAQLHRDVQSDTFLLRERTGAIHRLEHETLKRRRVAALKEVQALTLSGKELLALHGNNLVRLSPDTLMPGVATPFESAYDLAVAGTQFAVSRENKDEVRLYGPRDRTLDNIPRRSLIALTASGNVLCWSTQGQKPARFAWIDLTTDKRATAKGDAPLGGPFVLLPSGTQALLRNGTLVDLGTGSAESRYPPHRTATFASKHIWLLAADDTLQRFEMATGKRTGRWTLALQGYHLLIDERTNTLIVAGVDGNAAIEDARAAIGAELHLYRLPE